MPEAFLENPLYDRYYIERAQRDKVNKYCAEQGIPKSEWLRGIIDKLKLKDEK